MGVFRARSLGAVLTGSLPQHEGVSMSAGIVGFVVVAVVLVGLSFYSFAARVGRVREQTGFLSFCVRR
jgi:glucose uptake protein GlcU